MVRKYESTKVLSAVNDPRFLSKSPYVYTTSCDPRIEDEVVMGIYWVNKETGAIFIGGRKENGSMRWYHIKKILQEGILSVGDEVV